MPHQLRFGNILIHMHRDKPRKATLEDISGGKLTEILEGISEAIEVERVGLSREVDPLLLRR